MSPLTIYQLNSLVRGVIEDSLDEEYWVVGEFSDAKVARNGHFFGELVQKSEDGSTLVAKASVKCWAQPYAMLRLRFMRETGQDIQVGLKVLALVRVSFHELYGYSFELLDLDPSYTLGDMARRRQEILQRLEEEGILHDNQQLTLPVPLNRIAIVSSASAAGYGDFCRQLLENDYGLKFHIQLFQATMQGANVERSVLDALYAIADECDEWDAVVLIRGGGATSDLSDFDSYALASAIAQFPLPVIVGIGHDRDQTVLDMVAHTSLKTPTAVAAFLVEQGVDQLASLDALQQRIIKAAGDRLVRENHRLQRHITYFPMAFSNMKERQMGRIALLQQRLRMAVQGRLERESHRLDILSQRLELLNPDLLLKRGYSITLWDGKIVKNINEVPEGEVLQTRLQDGELYSKVLCKTKK